MTKYIFIKPCGAIPKWSELIIPEHSRIGIIINSKDHSEIEVSRRMLSKVRKDWKDYLEKVKQ